MRQTVVWADSAEENKDQDAAAYTTRCTAEFVSRKHPSQTRGVAAATGHSGRIELDQNSLKL